MHVLLFAEDLKKRKVCKFYDEFDTSQFTEKELDILNERKEMLF